MGRDIVSGNPVGIVPVVLVASLAVGGVSAIFVARKYKEHKLKRIMLNNKDRIRVIRNIILSRQIERLKGLVGFGASFGDSKAPKITYARGWIPVAEKPDFWYAPVEVPEEIIYCVIYQESKGNEKAYRREINNPYCGVSYGLMQICDLTADDLYTRDPSIRAVYKKGDYQSLYNPILNIYMGTRLLAANFKYFKDKYGAESWPLAVAAYNAGCGGVDIAIAKAGSTDISKVLPYLPSITQDYIRNVFDKKAGLLVMAKKLKEKGYA